MCVGTFLICLSISEIAVRILSPQSDLRRRDLLFRYEPFIGREGIPNKKGLFANTSFKTTTTHNNEGFRDYNHDKKNKQNKFRIITLGDSFTWGHGVEDDEIYMKVLENMTQLLKLLTWEVQVATHQQRLRHTCLEGFIMNTMWFRTASL